MPLLLKLPATKVGWKNLMWIALGRCTVCHQSLQQDWSLYDDGVSLWCLRCGGIRFPNGVFQALHENYLVHKEGE